MKTIVVYKSKYGSTERYANWLSKELSCEMIEASKVNLSTLLQYDTIILGGGLYAGRINGIELLTKHYDELKNKNLIVFSVGLSDPNNAEISKQVVDNNLTDKNSIKIFHLRGGIDHSKLKFMHKMMMNMMKKMLAKKSEGISEDQRQMLENSDFVDKTAIGPIIAYVDGQG